MQQEMEARRQDLLAKERSLDQAEAAAERRWAKLTEDVSAKVDTPPPPARPPPPHVHLPPPHRAFCCQGLCCQGLCCKGPLLQGPSARVHST